MYDNIWYVLLLLYYIIIIILVVISQILYTVSNALYLTVN